MTASIAIATYSDLPGLEDDGALLGALADQGARAVAAVWDDDVDWGAFDLVVVRSTWDYTEHLAAFLDWTRHVESVSTLLNPAAVLAWNTDKTYLRDLSQTGVPTVPTVWLSPGMGSRAIHTRMPARGEFVVKPTVSAGAKDTGRYRTGDLDDRGHALTLARGLLDAGRSVMIQPYLTGVDTEGETALVYIDGEFSHAVRKSALLGEYRQVSTAAYAPETMSAREPSAAERALGDRVLEALPGALRERLGDEAPVGPPLYARVDLLPGPDGEPVLLELELTEPSLFLPYVHGGHARFAAAVAGRVSEPRPSV